MKIQKLSPKGEFVQQRVYLIAWASAYLENSFGIFSGKYLFSKLVAQPRN